VVIERQQEDRVRVLQLKHHKANALDLELLGALEVELASAEADGMAVVLTGSGAIFSAGVNLFRLLDGGAPYLEAFLPALDAALVKLFAHPRPVVAAVNGHAMAGGWILACACDYRVMANGYGKLGTPELQVGVPFPPVPLEVLRYAMPPQHLQAMALAGKTFNGEEALRAGLVEEAVPPGEVVARAVAVASELARIPVEAYRLTKLQLRQPAIDRATAAAGVLADVHAAWKSPTTAAVIRGYLERVVGKGG
jgi:enoyl-CoA hydratase